jgi:hypothetical protein
MNESEEAVATVGEPVPVAGLDSRRAPRGVEQRVHRLAEFGLTSSGRLVERSMSRATMVR